MLFTPNFDISELLIYIKISSKIKVFNTQQRTEFLFFPSHTGHWCLSSHQLYYLPSLTAQIIQLHHYCSL